MKLYKNRFKFGKAGVVELEESSQDQTQSSKARLASVLSIRGESQMSALPNI